MAANKSKKTIEFYLNGKLYASVPYVKWDDELNKLKNVLSKKGYVELFGHTWQQNDETWYANKESKKMLVHTYRICTGYRDRNGHLLYQDDLVTNGSFESMLNGKPFDEDKYYIRLDRGWMSWTDIDIDDEVDASKLTKLRDTLFDKNKKMWGPTKIERFLNADF